MALDLRWVSCRKITSAFMEYMLAKICDLFSAILRPFAFRDTILNDSGLGEFPGWAISDGAQGGGKRVLGESGLTRLKDML